MPLCPQTIFAADDIKRQLPEESKRFLGVDKSWKAIMKRTNNNPNCLVAGTVKGMKETLQRHNEVLDQIQKSLEDYLETKRVAFPRFYFLSNEELLEVLAQTRDPQAVQVRAVVNLCVNVCVCVPSQIWVYSVAQAWVHYHHRLCFVTC